MSRADPPTLNRRRLIIGGASLLAVGCAPSSEGAPSTDRSPSTTLPTPSAPDTTTTANGTASPRYWPPDDGSDWETTAPEAAGTTPADVGAFTDVAGDRGTRALLLVHDGRLVVERYWGVDATFARDVASVQKSILALLAGVAMDRGLFRLDTSITEVLGGGWSAATPQEEREITVGHVLSMSSGLDDNLEVVAAPGSTWFYNTPMTQRIHRVLEAVTGGSIQALSDEWLFGPIGAEGTWQPRNENGPVASDAAGFGFLGLIMTARDLARVGLLVQRDGVWGDTQVIETSTLDATLRPSQPMNESYGRLWWLTGRSSSRLPSGRRLLDGPLVPDAPADTVAALGAGDQKLYESTSTKLVLVRLGAPATSRPEPSGSNLDGHLWSALGLDS